MVRGVPACDVENRLVVHPDPHCMKEHEILREIAALSARMLHLDAFFDGFRMGPEVAFVPDDNRVKDDIPGKRPLGELTWMNNPRLIQMVNRKFKEYMLRAYGFDPNFVMEFPYVFTLEALEPEVMKNKMIAEELRKHLGVENPIVVQPQTGIGEECFSVLLSMSVRIIMANAAVRTHGDEDIWEPGAVKLWSLNGQLSQQMQMLDKPCHLGQYANNGDVDTKFLFKKVKGGGKAREGIIAIYNESGECVGYDGHCRRNADGSISVMGRTNGRGSRYSGRVTKESLHEERRRADGSRWDAAECDVFNEHSAAGRQRGGRQREFDDEGYEVKQGGRDRQLTEDELRERYEKMQDEEFRRGGGDHNEGIGSSDRRRRPPPRAQYADIPSDYSLPETRPAAKRLFNEPGRAARRQVREDDEDKKKPVDYVEGAAFWRGSSFWENRKRNDVHLFSIIEGRKRLTIDDAYYTLQNKSRIIKDKVTSLERTEKGDSRKSLKDDFRIELCDLMKRGFEEEELAFLEVLKLSNTGGQSVYDAVLEKRFKNLLTDNYYYYVTEMVTKKAEWRISYGDVSDDQRPTEPKISMFEERNGQPQSEAAALPWEVSPQSRRHRKSAAAENVADEDAATAENGPEEDSAEAGDAVETEEERVKRLRAEEKARKKAEKKAESEIIVPRNPFDVLHPDHKRQQQRADAKKNRPPSLPDQRGGQPGKIEPNFTPTRQSNGRDAASKNSRVQHTGKAPVEAVGPVKTREDLEAEAHFLRRDIIETARFEVLNHRDDVTAVQWLEAVLQAEEEDFDDQLQDKLPSEEEEMKDKRALKLATQDFYDTQYTLAKKLRQRYYSIATTGYPHPAFEAWWGMDQQSTYDLRFSASMWRAFLSGLFSNDRDAWLFFTRAASAENPSEAITQWIAEIGKTEEVAAEVLSFIPGVRDEGRHAAEQATAWHQLAVKAKEFQTSFIRQFPIFTKQDPIHLQQVKSRKWTTEMLALELYHLDRDFEQIDSGGIESYSQILEQMASEQFLESLTRSADQAYDAFLRGREEEEARESRTIRGLNGEVLEVRAWDEDEEEDLNQSAQKWAKAKAQFDRRQLGSMEDFDKTPYGDIPKEIKKARDKFKQDLLEKQEAFDKTLHALEERYVAEYEAKYKDAEHYPAFDEVDRDCLAISWGEQASENYTVKRNKLREAFYEARIKTRREELTEAKDAANQELKQYRGESATTDKEKIASLTAAAETAKTKLDDFQQHLKERERLTKEITLAKIAVKNSMVRSEEEQKLLLKKLDPGTREAQRYATLVAERTLKTEQCERNLRIAQDKLKTFERSHSIAFGEDYDTRFDGAVYFAQFDLFNAENKRETTRAKLEAAVNEAALKYRRDRTDAKRHRYDGAKETLSSFQATNVHLTKASADTLFQRRFEEYVNQDDDTMRGKLDHMCGGDEETKAFVNTMLRATVEKIGSDTGDKTIVYAKVSKVKLETWKATVAFVGAYRQAESNPTLVANAMKYALESANLLSPDGSDESEREYAQQNIHAYTTSFHIEAWRCILNSFNAYHNGFQKRNNPDVIDGALEFARNSIIRIYGNIWKKFNANELYKLGTDRLRDRDSLFLLFVEQDIALGKTKNASDSAGRFFDHVQQRVDIDTATTTVAERLVFIRDMFKTLCLLYHDRITDQNYAKAEEEATNYIENANIDIAKLARISEISPLDYVYRNIEDILLKIDEDAGVTRRPRRGDEQREKEKEERLLAFRTELFESFLKRVANRFPPVLPATGKKKSPNFNFDHWRKDKSEKNSKGQEAISELKTDYLNSCAACDDYTDQLALAETWAEKIVERIFGDIVYFKNVSKRIALVGKFFLRYIQLSDKCVMTERRMEMFLLCGIFPVIDKQKELFGINKTTNTGANKKTPKTQNDPMDRGARLTAIQNIDDMIRKTVKFCEDYIHDQTAFVLALRDFHVGEEDPKLYYNFLASDLSYNQDEIERTRLLGLRVIKGLEATDGSFNVDDYLNVCMEMVGLTKLGWTQKEVNEGIDSMCSSVPKNLQRKQVISRVIEEIRSSIRHYLAINSGENDGNTSQETDVWKEVKDKRTVQHEAAQKRAAAKAAAAQVKRVKAEYAEQAATRRAVDKAVKDGRRLAKVIYGEPGTAAGGAPQDLPSDFEALDESPVQEPDRMRQEQREIAEIYANEYASARTTRETIEARGPDFTPEEHSELYDTYREMYLSNLERGYKYAEQEVEEYLASEDIKPTDDNYYTKGESLLRAYLKIYMDASDAEKRKLDEQVRAKTTHLISTGAQFTLSNHAQNRSNFAAKFAPQTHVGFHANRDAKLAANVAKFCQAAVLHRRDPKTSAAEKDALVGVIPQNVQLFGGEVDAFLAKPVKKWLEEQTPPLIINNTVWHEIDLYDINPAWKLDHMTYECTPEQLTKELWFVYIKPLWDAKIRPKCICLRTRHPWNLMETLIVGDGSILPSYVWGGSLQCTPFRQEEGEERIAVLDTTIDAHGTSYWHWLWLGKLSVPEDVKQDVVCFPTEIWKEIYWTHKYITHRNTYHEELSRSLGDISPTQKEHYNPFTKPKKTSTKTQALLPPVDSTHQTLCTPVKNIISRSPLCSMGRRLSTLGRLARVGRRGPYGSRFTSRAFGFKGRRF